MLVDIIQKSKEISDTALVQRCLRGDESAWKLLVERYARLVHSVPTRYRLPPAVVDDIGQEVFVALAQNLHRIEDPESLPGWLMTTTRRLSWRALKQYDREHLPADANLTDSVVAGVGSQIYPTAPSMSEIVSGWMWQEVLQQGLDHLGERCQKLLHLLFLDPQEGSYEDISTALDIPIGSIGPTRNRCLKRLRSILEGLGFSSLEGDM